MGTVITCTHEHIDWGYSFFSAGHSHKQGQCSECGLFIDERDGELYIRYNDKRLPQ
jgi:hypothetical protein